MAAIAGSPPRWTLNSQLLLAIRTQDVSRASQLLRAGVDVDTRFAINAQKRPALCLSVENNDLAMGEFIRSEFCVYCLLLLNTPMESNRRFIDLLFERLTENRMENLVILLKIV